MDHLLADFRSLRIRLGIGSLHVRVRDVIWTRHINVINSAPNCVADYTYCSTYWQNLSWRHTWYNGRLSMYMHSSVQCINNYTYWSTTVCNIQSQSQTCALLYYMKPMIDNKLSDCCNLYIAVFLIVRSLDNFWIIFSNVTSDWRKLSTCFV